MGRPPGQAGRVRAVTARCAQAVTRPMRDEDQLFIAIADPVRRTLIDAVLDRGEASVATLSHSVPVTRQAVSKHLTVLERAGLVTPRRQGREVRYSVRTERVDEAARCMVRLANEIGRAS